VSTEAPRVPLYARMGESGAAEFARLYPGVPAWLRESLWEWLRTRLCRFAGRFPNQYWDPNAAAIREIERITRVDSQWPGPADDFSARIDGLEALRGALYANESAFLTAVDLWLPRVSAAERDEIQQILEDGASEWRVGEL
jgi:hypothetical protein